MSKRTIKSPVKKDPIVSARERWNEPDVIALRQMVALVSRAMYIGENASVPIELRMNNPVLEAIGRALDDLHDALENRMRHALPTDPAELEVLAMLEY